MKRRIAILANQSGGLYDFRKDLIIALREKAEVYAIVPHNDRWDELLHLADPRVELPIDRRGMNRFMTASSSPISGDSEMKSTDLVLTYTIKPNIYGGLACRMAHIPYAVNITGLGSAIENGGWLKKFVLPLYNGS